MRESPTLTTANQPEFGTDADRGHAGPAGATEAECNPDRTSRCYIVTSSKLVWALRTPAVDMASVNAVPLR
jgi:hypothetical protein